MMKKKKSGKRLGRVVFGFFFAIVAIFSLLGNTLASQEVYADPPAETTTTETTTDTTTTTETTEASNETTGDNCKNSLGAIGWLVCPTTGKIAEAVDWLYDKLEGILVINPVSAEDGSPIYTIWDYCRGITNIVFIIFLLVVIYSQITGLGISNYGLKKALPKLIVVAILVNLSFLICSLAVDASNIVGSSLRGVFTSVEESAAAAMSGGGATSAEISIANAEMFSAVAGGGALAVGGALIAFETGAIWMLIPVVLGALVAVAVGLITIALRQAVVALLIMISPLAMVAYMLPNTENLFTKWRKLLTQMLVFYPMFSLLFGASSLAGFAIIASSQDGFGILLGTAVQIFPLFFSWKLMQMSGTFLGDINAKLRGLTASPLAKNRSWADSHRMAAKQKRLAQNRSTTPSLRLMQFISDRKVAREAEMAEDVELAKNRGLAYRARKNYDRNGVPTRRGEETYEKQAKIMGYQREVLRDKNNMELGLGSLKATEAHVKGARLARLKALDAQSIVESDNLKFEQARGEKIAADNARSFYERTEAAINWHIDDQEGYKKDKDGKFILQDGERVQIAGYKRHFENVDSPEVQRAATRYNAMSDIMEGNVVDVHFAAASAAHAYDTQKKIIETKYQKYFDLLPPTKDVDLRLSELTKIAYRNEDKGETAAKYIDAILPGLRILNQRGDTDVVQRHLENILNKNIGGGVELGTHASQALASFLMFEVKGGDPGLRRFGKYLNLETARAFNHNERKVMSVDYDEYIRGYHDGEPDLITKDNPTGRMYAKKPITTLLEGTSLDDVERTFFDNLNESMMRAYGWDEDHPEKSWDVAGYLKRFKEVHSVLAPQLISANLKYLSGSEQINASTKFLTGYKTDVHRDENGNIIGSELKSVWDKAEFKGHEDEVKSAYMEILGNYVGALTPSQSVKLRSDQYFAFGRHFADAFLNGDETELGLTEEDLEQRAIFKKELDEIQTRYGDLPVDEANEARERDKKALYDDVAGYEYRRLLDKNDTLARIYEMRRSGALRDTKAWNSKWLNLDNKGKIYEYLARKDKEKSESEKKNNVSSGDVGQPVSKPIYDSDFKTGIMAEIQKIFDDPDEDTDDDGSVFYTRSLEFLKKNLPQGGETIVEYEKYRENYPNAGRTLYWEKIDELIEKL